MAYSRQERQTCPDDSRFGGTVPCGARGAGVLQTTYGKIHSRLGIRRLKAGQHLHGAHVLQPCAPPQVTAGFCQCYG